MPQVKLVGLYDPNTPAAEAAAADFGTRAFTNLDELLSLVKAVTIATPTQFHATAAAACFAKRVACLIEKPLARDTAECKTIVEGGKKAGVVVQVGQIERFNPAVQALMKLNLKPRFIEATRVSPMTFRSLDVGVVLDMMIHDLDIVLKLAGSPLQRVDASGVSILGGVEDVCNARLVFENGCVANITASRVSLKTERRLRVFSSDAFVSIDYGQRSGVIARIGKNLATLRDAAAKVRAGDVTDLSQLKFSEMVNLDLLGIEAKDPLRAQAENFIAAVRGEGPPGVTAQDGMAAVDAAERIVAAMPAVQI
jgi:predicted dehydrogenase